MSDNAKSRWRPIAEHTFPWKDAEAGFHSQWTKATVENYWGRDG